MVKLPRILTRSRTTSPRLQMLAWASEDMPEFTRLPLPDLLHREPRLMLDSRAVHELLDLGFVGKDVRADFDAVLNRVPKSGGGFDPELFAEDLFLRELVRHNFVLEIQGYRYPVHADFLFRVLSDPPLELAAVTFRQDILRELDADPQVLAHSEKLYLELASLLAMLKSPDHAVYLDINSFRLDVLRQSKGIIDFMAASFATCSSGLARLGQAGVAIQASEEYAVLAALLDHEAHLVTLKLDVQLAGDGQIRSLDILEIVENRSNRFYLRPLRRWLRKLQLLLFHGFLPSNRELINSLLQEVFDRVSPALIPLVQLLGQLEFYLGSRGFRVRAQRRGLAMTLAGFTAESPLAIAQIFNPLLLDLPQPPVPTSIANAGNPAITVLTGPNSGGKTRLLQAIGLAQLLGQSGLYVPAAAANLPLVSGLAVSLIERETADQAEGRLGREMIRIRKVFASLRPPALVIFDELCSGTNPSEGIEIFLLVLRLLERFGAVAFLSTHFLEFARGLALQPEVAGLEFLQVEVDAAQRSTYQFIPGVATSSLAALTAERLGVTFDELVATIVKRLGQSPSGATQQ